MNKMIFTVKLKFQNMTFYKKKCHKTVINMTFSLKI